MGRISLRGFGGVRMVCGLNETRLAIRKRRCARSQARAGKMISSMGVPYHI